MKQLTGRVIVLAALVCGVIPGSAAAQTPPAPVVVFKDDFATYSRRWSESESPKASAVYREETFTISIVSPGVSLWSVPDFDMPLRDYHLEVSAVVLNGDADAQFGLIIGGDDEDQFYAWLITLDDAWLFLHHDAGTWHNLTPPEARLPDDTASRLSSDVMRLQVDVTHDGMAAFALNDYHLDPIALDAAFTGSLFGLIARAEHGFIEVMFDDVLVTTGVERNK